MTNPLTELFADSTTRMGLIIGAVILILIILISVIINLSRRVDWSKPFYIVNQNHKDMALRVDDNNTIIYDKFKEGDDSFKWRLDSEGRLRNVAVKDKIAALDAETGTRVGSKIKMVANRSGINSSAFAFEKGRLYVVDAPYLSVAIFRNSSVRDPAIVMSTIPTMKRQKWKLKNV